MAFLVDREKHLVQVPLVPRSGTPVAHLIDIGLPEFQAPIPYRLIGQDDATFRHELFDVPIAQAEGKVQPHAVADDLRREPMALVGVGCRSCVHGASMPHTVGTVQMGKFPHSIGFSESPWPFAMVLPLYGVTPMVCHNELVASFRHRRILAG
jgi:hypothetical protein